MKKDVMVSFKAYNKYEEDNSDKIEFLTKGNFFEKDGKYYLEYEEVSEQDSVKTVLKICRNQSSIEVREDLDEFRENLPQKAKSVIFSKIFRKD